MRGIPTIGRLNRGLGVQTPEMAVYPYLFFDDYSTDLAAGAVNGTKSSDGRDTRVVVDTGSRLSLSAGDVLLATGGTNSDPRLTYSGVTAVAGLAFFATIRQNVDSSENIVMRAGFDSAADGLVDNECMEFTLSAVVQARWGSSSVQAAGNYARLVNYDVCVLFLATEARWFIRGGAWADWTQLHAQATAKVTGGTTVYPAITCSNRNGAAKRAGLAILPASMQVDTMTLGGAESAILSSFFPSLSSLTAAGVTALFASTGAYVGIERVDADNYWLIQDLGGGQEWRVNLHNNGSAHCLEYSYVYEGATKVEDLFTWGSVWEYAFEDATYAWIGNGHGQDYQDSLVFEVDGAPVVLSDGQRVTGAAVTITRVSHFEAADTTPLGDCTLVYTLDPAAGLSTDITIDWDIAPVTGHGGMMPIDNRFSRGGIIGSVENFDLTIGEATSTSPTTTQVSSALCYAWEYGGNWAAMLATDHDRTTYIQDRSTDGNKIYTQEGGADLGGNIRHFTNNYRVKRMSNPNGAFLN